MRRRRPARAINSRDIVRLDAPAVDDVAVFGGVGAEPLAQPAANVRMRFLGLRGRGVPPGADRPHRLVGDDQLGDLLGGQAGRDRP